MNKHVPGIKLRAYPQGIIFLTELMDVSTADRGWQNISMLFLRFCLMEIGIIPVMGLFSKNRGMILPPQWFNWEHEDAHAGLISSFCANPMMF